MHEGKRAAQTCVYGVINTRIYCGIDFVSLQVTHGGSQGTRGVRGQGDVTEDSPPNLAPGKIN